MRDVTSGGPMRRRVDRTVTDGVVLDEVCAP
jgi:hypothetical protein